MGEAAALGVLLGFFVVAAYILWVHSSTKWGHRYQSLIEQYDLYLLHKVVDKRVPDLLEVMKEKYTRNSKVKKKLEDEMDTIDDELKNKNKKEE